LALILLANEFLDALPIRQLVRRGIGWAERFVDGGALVEQPAAAPDLDPARVEEGAITELCEPARAVVGHVARRVARDGGAALFLDYGPAESAPGDSLQALRNGRPASPFDEPGNADLTAHVDFGALARVARAAGAVAHGPMPQGVFLTRLGLFQRTGRLARTQPPMRAAALVQAAQRLAEPDRMGRLFKAMAVCHGDLPCPAGFEP
jgi:SAM-dependent MidA family methyltransferase